LRLTGQYLLPQAGGTDLLLRSILKLSFKKMEKNPDIPSRTRACAAAQAYACPPEKYNYFKT
jgi:hypothetical protein